MKVKPLMPRERGQVQVAGVAAFGRALSAMTYRGLNRGTPTRRNRAVRRSTRR
jgi:hypothetical protein